MDNIDIWHFKSQDEEMQNLFSNIDSSESEQNANITPRSQPDKSSVQSLEDPAQIATNHINSKQSINTVYGTNDKLISLIL